VCCVSSSQRRARSAGVPGITCFYQLSLPRQQLLPTGEFDVALREAVEAFRIHLPSRLDVLLVFDKPSAGFRGILLEAKSGEQLPDVALWQLKCYRAVQKARGIEPLLVWAVAEQGAPSTGLGRPVAEATADRWLLRQAESIGEAMTEIFGPQAGSGECREQRAG
jgi:hypothetical protein